MHDKQLPRRPVPGKAMMSITIIKKPKGKKGKKNPASGLSDLVKKIIG